MVKKDGINSDNECILKITGTQLVDGEKDVIEVTTKGNYYEKDQKHYLFYDESESTGFPGSQTTVEYEPSNGRITMTRTGPTSSQLIVEESVRHQCSYDTGYGTLMIGISGKKIKSTLEDKTGNLSFCYDLDVDTNLVSENSVAIEILP